MKPIDVKDSRTLPPVQQNGSGNSGEVIFPALEPPNDTIHQAVSPASVSKSPRRRWWAVVLTLVIAFVIAIYFYQHRKPIQVPATTSVDHTGHTSTATGSSTNAVPQTAVRINAEKQQLIGVQYGTVENQSLSKSLRAVGRAAFDETKMVRINPKIEGWIEDVYVDFTGKSFPYSHS